MSGAQNAFESVRPRGVDAPPSAAPPRKNRPGKAISLVKGPQRVLDARGRFGAPLAPRTRGGLVIENAEQGQQSADRRAALVRGGV